MSWHFPAALWLLLAVLLLLLVRRMPPRQRIQVANLYLWSGLESRPTSSLSRRWRRHKLLMLQAAFVTLVVLALAQPQLAWTARNAVIILDVSMSMGATHGDVTRLDAAKTHALSLVRELPLTGHAHVYLAGEGPVLLGVFSRGDPAAESALRAVRPTDASTHLDAVIERAITDTPPGAGVYVLSDTRSTRREGVTWVTFGEPVANVALTTLAVTRRHSDDSLALLVGAWNYAPTAAKTGVIITRDQETVAERQLELPATGGASVTLSIPNVAGILSARLTTVDGLGADNVRHTIVAPDEPLEVFLQGDSHYIEQALAVLPGVSLFVASATPPRAPDVVICAGCAEVPRDYPDTNVLLLPRGDRQTLEPASAIVALDAHPVMDEVNFDGALVTPIEGASLPSDAEILARAGGVPVIAAYERGRRRIVELRFDPDLSAVTGEPPFPLLVANIVAWLAPHSSTVINAGELIRVPHADGLSAIVGPDGREVPLRRNADEAIVTQTETAGIYRVTQRGGQRHFAVNPATTSESNLSADRSSGPSAVPAIAPAPLAINLSHVLLIAALAVLALEWRVRRTAQGA